MVELVEKVVWFGHWSTQHCIDDQSKAHGEQNLKQWNQIQVPELWCRLVRAVRYSIIAACHSLKHDALKRTPESRETEAGANGGACCNINLQFNGVARLTPAIASRLGKGSLPGSGVSVW